FFFQAEDGIRDFHVTGVQTCALPISGPQMNMDIALLPDANLNSENTTRVGWYWYEGYKGIKYANLIIARIDNATFKDEAERNARSEERRVGKGCRTRWTPYDERQTI